VYTALIEQHQCQDSVLALVQLELRNFPCDDAVAESGD
jgi:hypothetical protein